MRYQVLQLIQLLLALSLMVGAFLGGLWAGWWRWGRPHTRALDEQTSQPLRPGTLFSPADREDEIVLSEVELAPPGNSRHADRMVFATDHHLASPPAFSGGPLAPAAAIDPAPGAFATAERTDP